MSTQKQTVEAWADITIEKWKKNLATLQIGSKGELLNSFQKFIADESGGNVSKVRFAYLYYGKFVDMGAGRGSTAGKLKGKKRGANGKFVGQKKRVAKVWYSKTVFVETIILGQLMSDLYAAKGIAIVKDNLPSQVIINL